MVAALVIGGTARQSGQLDQLLGTAVDRRDAARITAGQALLAALLRPGANGIPKDYELRLFVPTEESGELMLRAEYESAGSTPSPGWRSGTGATGMAWRAASYVVARGRAVSDASYGLTAEQQHHFRDLEVVASAPVFDARARPRQRTRRRGRTGTAPIATRTSRFTS